MLDITLPLPYPQTPKSARALLRAHGVPITELAREIGVPRMTVVDLLRGLGKGHRGESHRAAIALGLKADPDTIGFDPCTEPDRRTGADRRHAADRRAA